MADRYDSIYLSPHPDDAVFSCGGRIYYQCEQGLAVLVATVATRDPRGQLSRLARRLGSRSRMDPASMEVRRQEDRTAIEILGADLIHADFEDAVHRHDSGTGKPIYPTLRSLFGKVSSSDDLHRLDLEAVISKLPPHSELVIPLAVGRHVDHQLVRSAAEKAARAPLLYYEDFPYSRRSGATQRLLRPRRDWHPSVIALPLDAQAAKQRAALAYGSQIDLVFGSPRKLRGALRAHTRRFGGERYWHRSPSR